MTGPADDVSVGVVVSRRVPASRAGAFESLTRQLIEAARQHPGHRAAEVLRTTPGDVATYFIVYRFDDDATLRAWEASSERRRLVARIDDLTVGGDRRELTGLEAWFDLPNAPAPPRHRMALLTWVGIWPLVSLAQWLATPLLASQPFLVRTGITSAALVLAMTYLVMPPLARFARGWLLRP